MEKRIGDMYLAASYLSYNFSLAKIDKADPTRQRFIFTDESKPKRIFIVDNDGIMMTMENPNLEDVEVKFLSKQLLYPPSYPDSLRRIKASIHSAE